MIRLAALFFLSLLAGCVSSSRLDRGVGTESAPGPAGANPQQTTLVKVIARKDGAQTHFEVRNDEFAEVTVTFDFALENLQGDVRFPYTMTFPARQTIEAFVLSPVQSGTRWSFDYTNYIKLGSACAQHDDSFAYQLPYAPGDKHKVTQGFNGSFSHKGSNQYAIDWKMPEGTPVYAARGGVVVRVKDDSDQGGASKAYDKYNNYVLIRHDDGTLGHYCHLQQGGCVVKVGQVVACGELIARSGNTGFTSGAHLHFCVFKTKNGRERESVPVKFRTATDQAVTLTEGQSYKAAEFQVTSVKLTAAHTPSVETRVR